MKTISGLGVIAVFIFCIEVYTVVLVATYNAIDKLFDDIIDISLSLSFIIYLTFSLIGDIGGSFFL
ncbi:ORF MSV051 hypothetical protein [Melanoplus sanguinipes entomopoxvirus]|uniref:Uncharacterized protein n=1 Tax=Melanoplus sanguinipes entomopoxvirus TaxID=83191 RepID=Q9YW41_MSEPV|nr:ORF MSV051 hypothetical protein [Melanoplus sanguinipes entomopoxvirus]AAC97826.1 ORF MSV051 hypothetical protein [Melanoplus sanguinipes entomopoxvirus 'O']